MGIKEEMMKRGMKAMSDPRVAKLMQNEQFMKVLMALLQVPGKVNTFTNEQAKVLAGTLRLATAEDVKDLQRALKRLERSVAKLEEHLAGQGQPHR
jgi:hypothetical protein